MSQQIEINSLLKDISNLRFALTDALCTLQQVHGYAVMSKQDVERVEESLHAAESALEATDCVDKE